MARIEESVEIKRPGDRVFAYTTDVKSWSKWQSILPESEQTSPGSMAVGAMTKGKFHIMGLTMKWTGKVTEYEPNRKFGKDIICGPITNEQHNTYETVQGGTKFTILYDMRVGGFMKPFSSMIVSSMRKELKKSLGNLKGILEAQT
jgi:hypothetical protein